MVVESVRVHVLSSQHVVILKETERDRYLPIWIGPSEANAIAMAPGDQRRAPADPRPARVRAGRGPRQPEPDRRHPRQRRDVPRAAYLETAEAGETEIDSRTSDAIAVAIGRVDHLRRRAGPRRGGRRAGANGELGEDDEKLAVFRDFVNSLDVDLGPTEGRPPPNTRPGRGCVQGPLPIGPQLPAQLEDVAEGAQDLAEAGPGVLAGQSRVVGDPTWSIFTPSR